MVKKMNQRDGLPRNGRGVRIDVRGGKRTVDKIFSKWHRTLERRCYVTDIDFLEYRISENEIILKAIFEVKEWHVTQPKYIEENANFKAIKKLCEILKLPFYVIWCKFEGDVPIRFKIWDVFNESKSQAKEVTPDQLRQFIESL